MRRKKIFIAIVILLVLGFAGYQRWTGDIEFEVPGWVGGGQREPFYAISGHFILYHGPNNRLTVYDIQKGTQTKIDSTMNFRNRRPSICDPWVVWLDGRSERYSVAGYDLRCGQYFSIDLDNIYKPGNPQIDGSTLVWVEGFTLNGYDLQTQRKFVACEDLFGFGEFGIPGRWRPTSEYTSRLIPGIEGDTIVWENVPGTDGILGYDLKTRQRFSIPGSSSWHIPPKVSGRYVVWLEKDPEQDIPGKFPPLLAYDRISGEAITLSSGTHRICTFDVSGDIVVWDAVVQSASQQHIFGYNLTTRQSFPICTADGNQYKPKISGNTVIWVDEQLQQGWLARLLKKEPILVRGKIFRHWPGEGKAK
jgi:hypothetical protein